MTLEVVAHDGPIIKDINDPQFKNATPGKIGMWIFLGTDALSFAGLLMAYAAVRLFKHAQWPNPAEALGGVELSGFMTFLLICSSVSMVLAIDACKHKDRKNLLFWLGVTILGGMSFLGIQAVEYHHLITEMGMSFNSYEHGTSLFSSTFFSITGFHGLHVLTGTIYLMNLFVMAYKGYFDKGDYNLLEIAGLFWHFVDLVWILVFTFVYLL